MRVYELTDKEIDSLRRSLTGKVHAVKVAFDPLDDAVKFKLNDGSWSPPFGKRVAPADDANLAVAALIAQFEAEAEGEEG